MKAGKAFSHILRIERKRLGISQLEFATLAQLDRTFCSLLERGLRQPSLETLFNVAFALQVTPHELVRRIEELVRRKRARVARRSG